MIRPLTSEIATRQANSIGDRHVEDYYYIHSSYSELKEPLWFVWSYSSCRYTRILCSKNMCNDLVDIDLKNHQVVVYPKDLILREQQRLHMSYKIIDHGGSYSNKLLISICGKDVICEEKQKNRIFYFFKNESFKKVGQPIYKWKGPSIDLSNYEMSDHFLNLYLSL